LLRGLSRDATLPDEDETSMISAREALAGLRERNRRFVSGVRGSAALTDRMLRRELAARQKPFAR
jgi:hypothetical protein